VDVEISVARDEDHREARITKSKDGDDEGVFPFRLKVVELGVDEEGLPVNSCIVEYTEAKAGGERFSANEKLALDAIGALADMETGRASIKAVIAAAARNIPRDEEAKTDNRKRDVRRALEVLRKRGVVELNSDDDTVEVL
jgi:hypothetical protein